VFTRIAKKLYWKRLEAGRFSQEEWKKAHFFRKIQILVLILEPMLAKPTPVFAAFFTSIGFLLGSLPASSMGIFLLTAFLATAIFLQTYSFSLWQVQRKLSLQIVSVASGLLNTLAVLRLLILLIGEL
jgi:hypothetical protein